MVSTFTPNRGYELQGTGDNVNTWGSTLNSSVFGVIDKNMGGAYNFSTTGGLTTISSTNAQNLVYTVSGTLSSNATVQFPNVSGFYFLINATTGPYTVTATGVSGGSVLIYGGAAGTLLLVASGVLSRALPLPDTPGDVKPSLAAASDGWLLMNGTTYGPAGSGATQRVHNDMYALYVLQWDLGFTPVGGRGANAAADWAAAKPMPTPDWRGRVPAGRDGMGGGTAGRLTTFSIATPDSVLGTGGTEGVSLTSSNNGPHTHTLSIDPVGDHTHGRGFATAAGGSAGGAFTIGNEVPTAPAGAHTHTGIATSSGSGTAHLNVQPTAITNYLIKY